MANKIFLCLAHMNGKEQDFIKDAFDTNWVAPYGPNVRGFESDLGTFFGRENKVCALSSGTSAIHLALIGCGVKAGDEVIVQSFTFCASCNPVSYLGATPVFVDSERDTWNMDPDLLEVAIKDRIAKTGKKPKAIIPVALYGMPYNVDRIMEIAGKYEIPVVEDSAEGFGSRWKGQFLGTFGEYGILSFNGNKMITTSGGGALICREEENKNRLSWMASQAREDYPYYHHNVIGYNYRMSNVCAGIGRGQMTVVEEHIAHHRHVQQLYETLFSDVDGITVHKQPDTKWKNADGKEGSIYESNYWLCCIEISPELRVVGQEKAYKEVVLFAVSGTGNTMPGADRPTTDFQPNDNVEALRLFLAQAGIETRPLWKPMHKQPIYNDAPSYVNGTSESLFKVGLCLPSGPCVSDKDVKLIVETIKSAIIKRS